LLRLLDPNVLVIITKEKANVTWYKSRRKITNRNEKNTF